MPTNYKQAPNSYDDEAKTAHLAPEQEERINIRVKARHQLKIHALQRGKTLTEYINEAINEKIQKDLLNPVIPGSRVITVTGIDTPPTPGRPASEYKLKPKPMRTRFNISEKIVARKWAESGWFVLADGAPDFLMIRFDNKGQPYRTVAVEVKNRRQPRLSPEQLLYKKILENAGFEFRIEIIGDDEIEREGKKLERASGLG
jgi:hypothetical protein